MKTTRSTICIGVVAFVLAVGATGWAVDFGDAPEWYPTTLSEDGARESRACDLSMVFHVDEYASGLEIESFHSAARWELPGSWTLLRGEEATWMPSDPKQDPIELAAEAAVQRFLLESLEFWKSPAHWREGGVKLSSANLP